MKRPSDIYIHYRYNMHKIEYPEKKSIEYRININYLYYKFFIYYRHIIENKTKYLENIYLIKI